MKLIEIAAVGKNGELGYHGDMPWKRSLKNDLKFFRDQTRNHAMVMGRRTFESLPGLLPRRKHIVITTSDMSEALAKYPRDLEVFSSLEDFERAYSQSEETIYVIGGGSLYSQLLEKSDMLLLTEIDAEFEADTWFPDFNRDLYTREVLDEQIDGGYQTRHVRWKKIGSDI